MCKTRESSPAWCGMYSDKELDFVSVTKRKQTFLPWKKVVEFNPTWAILGRHFQAASIWVRLMCNLSLKKMWLLWARLQIKCGVYTRLYGCNGIFWGSKWYFSWFWSMTFRHTGNSISYFISNLQLASANFATVQVCKPCSQIPPSIFSMSARGRGYLLETIVSRLTIRLTIGSHFFCKCPIKLKSVVSMILHFTKGASHKFAVFF